MFYLPHFTTHTKDERGHGLSVHLIVLLLRAEVSQLRLLTVPNDHDIGANHVIEAIHFFLNDETKCRLLPKTLFLKL